jgi:hypothetical protein
MKQADDSERRENIFEIMDGIIDQLNKTKKLFIIMILTIMIIPPIVFAISFALLGPSFQFEGDGFRRHGGFAGPQRGFLFGAGPFIPILIVLVWLGIGIRQWFALSKWSKRYERYRELQKKIDEKLDNDLKNDVNGRREGGKQE